MKKIYLATVLLFSLFLLKGQTNEQLLPNPPLDQLVLFKNHPLDLDDYMAADIIQGKKKSITRVYEGEFVAGYANKGFLFIEKLNYSKKRKDFSLGKSSEPRWKVSDSYFVYQRTGINWYFWGFGIGIFSLMFLVLLPIINSCEYEWNMRYKWSGEKFIKKKILKLELIYASIVGLVFYFIYLGTLSDNAEPLLSSKFKIWELFIMVTISLAGGFFYIGIFSVVYEVQKFMDKQKQKPVLQ